ncbi:hypothetical protein [Sulfurovum sp.]|uniref:hypothetical protein n=1 Tax=Sulfurovum sp. TaxID=1969726 RepID=UPI0035698C89
MGALGIDFTYDTRGIREKYYPKDATLIGLSLNSNPSGWGNGVTYYSASLNFRHYTPGLKEDDVWANQFYGKYVTASTPDNGLPTIGKNMIIRGFPIGKYKARYLSAFQSEYRYQFTGSKYKSVAFAGVANLSGGSKGTLFGSRDNNGNYYSGGIELRYAIQPQAGIDLRVDIVTNSDHEQSVYVGVNQSF